MSNLITPASIVHPKVVMWLRLMKVLSNFLWIPWSRNQSLVGKVQGVNVQAKSLTTYFADMTFCNYPQLLLMYPQRQTQVETMGKKLLKQVIKNCFLRKYSSSSHMLTTQTNKRCHTLSLCLLFSLKVAGTGTTRYIAKKKTQNDTCSMMIRPLRSVVRLH